MRRRRQVGRDLKKLLVDRIGVPERVPPGVDSSEKFAAANILPVVSLVVQRGLCFSPGDACVWPTGLCDPDGLVADCVEGSVVESVEEGLGVGEGVVLVLFVVGIDVYACPVDGIDYCGVRFVDP